VVSLHNAGTLCFRVLELHVIGIGVEHFTPNADSEDRRSRVAGHLVQLSLLVEEPGRIESLCHRESNRIVQVDQSRARVDDGNDAGVVGVSGGFFWGRSSQSGLSWILPGLGDRGEHGRLIRGDGEAVHGHRVELVNFLVCRVDADGQDGHGNPAWRKGNVWVAT
jgi:hypothetical protein